MDVFASLAFEDLTGQRLKKIASGIQDVQSRILKLLILVGMKDGGREADSCRQEALLPKFGGFVEGRDQAGRGRRHLEGVWVLGGDRGLVPNA